MEPPTVTTHCRGFKWTASTPTMLGGACSQTPCMQSEWASQHETSTKHMHAWMLEGLDICYHTIATLQSGAYAA